MRPENPSTPHEGGSRKASLIRLVLILIVGLTAISIVAMLAIFFLSGKSDAAKDAAKEVNVNITTPPATPFSPNTPVIRQAPPPSPAKPVKQPSMPAPPAMATPCNNTNEQSVPKQTPQPLPSESPP
jgi:type IV secretory pathway VirB10-like protein